MNPNQTPPIAIWHPEDHADQLGSMIVCTQDVAWSRSLAEQAGQWGISAAVCDSFTETVQHLHKHTVDVCIIDETDADQLQAIISSNNLSDSKPVSIISYRSKTIDAHPEDQAGTNRIAKHLDPSVSMDHVQATLLATIERTKLLQENLRLKKQLSSRLSREILGNSQTIQQLRDNIQNAADSNLNVLITGEPGTGTNLAAQCLHLSSRQTFRPFLRLDCSVLNAETLERQIFGPAKSADNHNSESAQCGITQAGTLFIDNIDQLPQSIQKKLEQTITQGFYQPAPHLTARPLNARIVAATHQNDVTGQATQSDLIKRLVQVTIQTPPLRDHLEDVSLLVEHFLNQQAVSEGKPIRRLSMDVLDLLLQHDWPGNVRELKNVIERTCSIEKGNKLTAEMIRPWIVENETEELSVSVGLTLREMERKLIESTFERFGGNREKTAKSLQIGLRTLSGKLREYGYPPRGGPGSNRKAA